MFQRPIVSALSGLALVPAAVWAAGVGSPARAPISFEKNLGQAAAETLFLARQGDAVLHVTSTGMDAVSKNGGIRMSVAGGRDASLRGTDRLAGVSHYYRGADRSRWITGVPHFARLEQPGIYEGIDLVYHGGDLVEYDFVVHPGADPGTIELRFEGAPLSVDAAGDLHAGELVHRRPSIYQTIDGKRVAVSGGFRVDGDQVRFDVGEYRRDADLVIDPVVVFATFLGGNGQEQINGMVVLGGQPIIVGTTSSTNFAGDPVNRGFTDIFITRYTADGSALVYSVFVGGSGVDQGQDIAYNALAGELVVVGTSASEDFPATTGSFQPANRGGFDAVVARLFAHNGQLIRSTYYGGSVQDDGLQIAVDSAGGIVIAGNTISTDIPLENATDSTLDNSDVFLARFTQGLLVLQFGTYLGGASVENVWALAADGAGNAWVGGTTFSGDFPVVNAFQAAPHSTDGFLTKFNLITREIVTSTYLGGASTEAVRGIAIDGSGSVYVTGETLSPDFPTTPGAYDPTIGGPSDIFVSKFTGSTLVWSTFIGGSAAETSHVIALGPGGIVAIGGSSNSTDFPTVAAPQPALRGFDDAVALRLNASGSALLDSTFLGGTLNDVATAVGFGDSNVLFVAGNTDSLNFPVTPGAMDFSFAENEGFVAALADGPAPVAVTVQSNIPGAVVIVDGARIATPKTFLWMPGVQHTIGADELQQLPGNQTLTWLSWTGAPGGAKEQTFATPAAAATYTASFSALTCTYAVLPNPLTIPLSGGSFTVSVFTQAGCPWTGHSNDGWISGSGPGAGSGSVNFHATASSAVRNGSVTVAFTSVAIRQEDAVPSVIDLAPFANTGSEQLFTLTFDDSAGANTIAVANLLINSAIDGRQACYLAITPTGSVFLVNDAGAGGGPFAGGLALPSTASISNTQCAVDGEGSSVLRTGTRLIVKLKLRFLAPFAGNKVMYLAVRDVDGNNSGWRAKGVWTVPGAVIPTPGVVSLSPRSFNGNTVTLTATYYDTLGPLHFDVLNILVNDSIDGRNACYVALVRNAATAVLVNDTGDAGGPFAGAINIPSFGTASNSQCTIDADGSSIVPDGKNLIFTLKFHWKTAFKGERIIYLAARDINEGNSGWEPMGIVTVP
ncbi:MAG: SBBP repeat-containing protein [Bryobacteraceae bacterium]